MIDAERQNREVALLSNSLHEFQDNDVIGRKPVVEKILNISQQRQWTRYEIDNGEPHPDSIEKPAKTADVEPGQSESEMKDELRRTGVNISKYKAKIENSPDHKRIESWKIELERLEAVKMNLEIDLISVQNA